MGWAKFTEDIQKKKDDLKFFSASLDNPNSSIKSELDLKTLQKKLKNHTDEFLQLFSEITDIAKNPSLVIAKENFELRSKIRSLENLLPKYKKAELRAIFQSELKVFTAEKEIIYEDKLRKETERIKDEFRTKIDRLEAENKNLKIKGRNLNRKINQCKSELANEKAKKGPPIINTYKKNPKRSKKLPPVTRGVKKFKP